jgi:hypothetical protein
MFCVAVSYIGLTAAPSDTGFVLGADYWRPVGLRDVKDLALFRQSAHRWR